MQVFVLVPACANVTEGNSITPQTCIVFSISSRYKEFIPFEANTESGKTITRYPLSFSNPIHLSSISNSELTLPSAIFNFCKIGYFSKLSNPISCSAPKGGFVNIFAGVIKCVDCGCALRAMNVHRRKRPEIIDCVQYSCNNYARNGRSECSAHNIEARDLFNAVLADINCFADMAVNDEKAVRAIEKRLTETDQSRAKALEKERKKLNKRLAELDRLFSSLYEDKVMERITERNFEMMSGKYQKEQLEIEARLKEVTETLNESYEKSRGIRDFLALIRNYQGLKELDATVINALIDKILVSEREKMADGTVKQEIKIYYKFIGFVDELHIIPTKRWAAMPAKNCTVCGVEYVPGSGASRYCPACAKKIRREKSNESKRRSREQKRIACMNCPQKMTD